MSKELTGQGDYIVGSQNYFRSLNEKTFIAYCKLHAEQVRDIIL